MKYENGLFIGENAREIETAERVNKNAIANAKRNARRQAKKEAERNATSEEKITFNLSGNRLFINGLANEALWIIADNDSWIAKCSHKSYGMNLAQQMIDQAEIEKLIEEKVPGACKMSFNELVAKLA